MIKELCEGPVGDYCIACNTIKCLFVKNLKSTKVPTKRLHRNLQKCLPRNITTFTVIIVIGEASVKIANRTNSITTTLKSWA